MSNQDFDVYLARGSNLSQRYRDEASDKPSQAIDSAILTASRRAPAPIAAIQPQSWFRRWRVPLSVGAVMLLGVGVTLRTVMQEATLSAPPPMTLPEPESAPAAAKPAEDKASADSAAGVVMGGAATSAPAAPPPPELDVAKKKDAEIILEEAIVDEAPAPPYPAAPPQVRQNNTPLEMPATAPSTGAAPGRDALESQAGRSSSGRDMGKAKSAPVMERDDAAAPAAPEATKRDDETLARRREQAPQKPSESDAPGAAPEPAVIEAPQAFPGDGPRLPEGHRPIVDGKTYRAERERGGAECADKSEEKKSEEEAPEAWLRRVAELRRVGRYEEANAELERFRKRYPDYSAPVER